jgi:hypothetical protein
MKQLLDTYEDFAEKAAKLEQVASPAQWMALAVFESGELCLLRPNTVVSQIRQTQHWPEKLEDDLHSYPRFDRHLHRKEHLPICHQHSESDHQSRPVVPVPATRQVPSDILIRVTDILCNAPSVPGRLPAHTQQWKAVLPELGFVVPMALGSPSASKLKWLPDPTLHQIGSPFQPTESHLQTVRALLTDCLESHASL